MGRRGRVIEWDEEQNKRRKGKERRKSKSIV